MAPVVRAPELVRAHWIKAGEASPFDGLVLSPEAYSGLREKIARLETELASCRSGAKSTPSSRPYPTAVASSCGGHNRVTMRGGAR